MHVVVSDDEKRKESKVWTNIQTHLSNTKLLNINKSSYQNLKRKAGLLEKWTLRHEKEVHQ